MHRYITPFYFSRKKASVAFPLLLLPLKVILELECTLTHTQTVRFARREGSYLAPAVDLYVETGINKSYHRTNGTYEIEGASRVQFTRDLLYREGTRAEGTTRARGSGLNQGRSATRIISRARCIEKGRERRLVIERSFGSSIDRDRIRGRGAPYLGREAERSQIGRFFRPPAAAARLNVSSCLFPRLGKLCKAQCKFSEQPALPRIVISPCVHATYELAAREFTTGPLAVFSAIAIHRCEPRAAPGRAGLLRILQVKSESEAYTPANENKSFNIALRSSGFSELTYCFRYCVVYMFATSIATEGSSVRGNTRKIYQYSSTVASSR